MKKIFAVLMVVSMLAVCAFSANAAGITAAEQKIIDAASQEIVMACGSKFVLPDKFINQTEDYLTKADLSDEDINKIVDAINKAAAAIATNESEDISKAPASVKAEIFKQIHIAADVVGADAHITEGTGTNAETYALKLVFVDSNVEGYETGKEVTFTTKNDEIVQTGAEGSMVATVVASVLVLAAAAFVVVSSQKKALSK